MDVKEKIRNMILSAACAVAGVVAYADYTPEQWNLEARRTFAEQRFGIFIVWGIYATYGQGEWYQHDLRMDSSVYGRIRYGFYPSKFNAKEWARIFKGAGAKYVTITARHHDGFSLWASKADDGYNISSTPFKRDVLGELAAACKDEGIQFNLYYSLMDWHRGDYPSGRLARRVLGRQKGDYGSYKRFMLAQLAELIDGYRPGVIWLDGEDDHAYTKNGKLVRTLDWDFDSIFDLIHAKKTLVANNSHRLPRAKEDIQLFERDLPGGEGFAKGIPVADDRPVEQCDVIQRNVWGYRIGEKNFRTGAECVELIVRAAAHDSNLLLNIGPDGSGQIPAQAVAVFADIGKWMAANGEAIYATRGAGLVKNADGSETAKTRKGDKVFTITLRKGQYPVVDGLR